ncbi:MAG TPA: hypothetical protein VFV78_07850 [Vicinamibacterales bacterium]|nr:hypothetical protein [Vicinamibacterales bacterium]
MARGWESKSVEAQQEDREVRKEKGPAISIEAAARLERRRVLELTRARAIADLAAARSPAHRQMLEAAIRSLDEQLRGPLAHGPLDQLESME